MIYKTYRKLSTLKIVFAWICKVLINKGIFLNMQFTYKVTMCGYLLQGFAKQNDTKLIKFGAIVA